MSNYMWNPFENNLKLVNSSSHHNNCYFDNSQSSDEENANSNQYNVNAFNLNLSPVQNSYNFSESYYRQRQESSVNSSFDQSSYFSTPQSVQSINSSINNYQFSPNYSQNNINSYSTLQYTNEFTSQSQIVRNSKSTTNCIPKVKLNDLDIWQQFSYHGTEMIVTKSGR
jgi:hypothetical protein